MSSSCSIRTSYTGQNVCQEKPHRCIKISIYSHTGMYSCPLNLYRNTFPYPYIFLSVSRNKDKISQEMSCHTHVGMGAWICRNDGETTCPGSTFISSKRRLPVACSRHA